MIAWELDWLEEMDDDGDMSDDAMTILGIE